MEIKDLSVDFHMEDRTVHAVQKVSFSIEKGKTLGLVGESGSGKSVTSLCTMGLLASPPGQIVGGEIFFHGEDILKASPERMRQLRGNKISMIFQEPMTSLNPVFSVGYQIAESLVLHKRMDKKEAWLRAVELLDQVGIPNAKRRAHSFPHELSGGQRQRVMIAMAISCEPELLIADEPTTALDVTIQKQILTLLSELQEKYQMSVLFITHDLGVIGEIADQVVVMYKGKIMERGTSSQVFQKPEHPYTRGLLECRPTLDKNYSRLPMVSNFMSSDLKPLEFDVHSLGTKNITKKSNECLVEIKDLKKYYPVKRAFWQLEKKWVRAVDGVSFKVLKGRTLGLVGESGCGKTTLGRTLLRLIEPSQGQVIYSGKNITDLPRRELRNFRRKMQIIFQDPYASLNPRMTVGKAIMEPMMIHKLGNKNQRMEKAVNLMEKVGLEPDHLKRFPHEFSGGQRQRICIARALAVEPEFIICDESVSALDVSIQAQIINLLLDLQKELGLTYIFISHDLGVVKFISDEVAVMNQGKIVEFASASDIYLNPQDSYTKSLLDSIPKPQF